MGDLVDERTFLDAFQLFCSRVVPGNPNLRDSLISRIQAASSVSLKPFSWYSRDAVFPVLPDNWNRKTPELLNRTKITYINIENVNEQSLRRLRSEEMLNDEVVEGYLHLIRKKTGLLIGTTTLLERFDKNSGFYQCEGNQGPINEALDYAHLIQSGQLVVPVYHAWKHWTFAHVLLRAHDNRLIINYYDSLECKSLPQKVQLWLSASFPHSQMNVCLGPGPRQTNGVDCGLFMLMGIRMIGLGSAHLSQSEADEVMPSFRNRILAEILSGSLDPSQAQYTEFVNQDEIAANDYRPPENFANVPYIGAGNEEEPIDLDTPNSDVASSVHENPKIRPDAGIKETPITDDAQEIETVQDIVKSDLSPLEDFSTLDLSAEMPPLAPTFERTETGITSKQASKHKNPTIIKASRSQKTKNVELYADCFGDETAMIQMLLSAVQDHRARNPMAETIGSLKWKLGEIECDQGIQSDITYRFTHEQFSRAFWFEVWNQGGDSHRVPPHIRYKLMEMMGIIGEDSSTRWKNAIYQAKRSYIWIELVDLVMAETDLGPDSIVALCAISESNTPLEVMKKSDRDQFINRLRDRLRVPGNRIIPRLRAASPLFHALATWGLGDYTIPIERTVDLSLMSFAEIVSLRMAPSKLRLPDYS